MNRIIILFSFLVLALFQPGYAKAQQADVCVPTKEALHQPEPQDFVQEEVYEKRRERMVMLDHNCDGVIDANERVSAITKMFQDADLDHDGILSTNEQESMVEAFTAKTAKIVGATKIVHTREMQTALHFMDKDHDGAVTPQEFGYFYATAFRGMDADGNDIIDINEFRENFEGVRRIRN